MTLLSKLRNRHPPEAERSPCDWDHESYCCMSDGMPATHRILTGMIGDTPVYDLVCCVHSVSNAGT